MDLHPPPRTGRLDYTMQPASQSRCGGTGMAQVSRCHLEEATLRSPQRTWRLAMHRVIFRALTRLAVYAVAHPGEIASNVEDVVRNVGKKPDNRERDRVVIEAEPTPGIPGTCRGCGQPYVPGAIFCKCGKQVPASDYICPSCRKTRLYGSSICSSCGSKMPACLRS